MSDRINNVNTQINPATLEHQTLAFLMNYWNAKRGERAMPSRGDIRASDLKEHLGWVMIVEVLPQMADFRYRLIGTLVTQYFLSDGTGKTVTEIYAKDNPLAGKGITAIFRKCARDKCIVRAFGEAGWIGEGFEQFDCLTLPLSDDGETVHMLLHAFVFDRPSVLMAREVARANGGKLLVVPKPAA